MKYFLVFVCLFYLYTVLQAVQSCSPRQPPNIGNRKCKKSCRTKADCVSSKKDCVCDGTCGLSCINTNTDCERLRQPQHGTATISPFNKFGAVARYRCNDGYSLKGAHFRVCQGDRKWSDDEPICVINSNFPVKVECGEPPIVHNAHHNGAEGQRFFDLGVMLQYSCDEGFSSSENKVDRAWCVGGGVWVGPNMTCNHAGCPLPNKIPNGGFYAPTTNNKGAKLTYYCDEGYHLSNLEYRTCLPDGTWDGLEPSCEKVLCRRPPEIEHATHDGTDENERYPSGRQLTYECMPGYYREGNARAMCNGDGQWVGLTLSCSARNCGFPGDIENGWRTGYMFEFPHKVAYHCNEGYDLEGQAVRRCEANGKWSGRRPRCIAVECVHMETPEHGRLVGYETAFGTVVRIECDEGFKIMGSKERRCQADRQWSGPETTCTQINCGSPGPFYNGYVLGHKTSVGAVMFFSCNTRTNFEGASFEATCQENGEWSSPPPTCWGQCEIPAIEAATLLEGMQQGTWVRHLTRIKYRCGDGLVPDETNTVTCYNGTWKNMPKCVPSPCPRPPKHVDNGLRIYEGLKHGDRAKYKCWNGYVLKGMNEGASFLVCEYGIWRGGNPRCDRLYCPNPGSLSHGKIFKKVLKGVFEFSHYIKKIKHGIRIHFQCDYGYARIGYSGATCVNGRWRPGLDNPGTKCVKQQHAHFPPQWLPVQEMERPT